VILLIRKPQNSRAGSNFAPAKALKYRIGYQPGLNLKFKWRIDHRQAASVEPVGICDVP
jgi:hypothetical protein